MRKKTQLILNGHNEHVEKAVSLLSEPLSKLVNGTRGLEGDDLDGIMNFYWMEFTTILRKAAAIGYEMGLEDKSKSNLSNKKRTERIKR